MTLTHPFLTLSGTSRPRLPEQAHQARPVPTLPRWLLPRRARVQASAVRLVSISPSARPARAVPALPKLTRPTLPIRSPPFLIPDVERLAQRERVRHDPHFSVGARRDGVGQGGFAGQDDAGRRGLPPPGKILRGVTCFKVRHINSRFPSARRSPGASGPRVDPTQGTTDASFPASIAATPSIFSSAGCASFVPSISSHC